MNELVARSQAVLIENYGRLPLAFVRGQNAKIWDADGREYIDFFPGPSAPAASAGHCNPKITQAVVDQAGKLTAHGNLTTSEPQVRLAEAITTGRVRQGKVFYCHSGAEANEAALEAGAPRCSRRRAEGRRTL